MHRSPTNESSFFQSWQSCLSHPGASPEELSRFALRTSSSDELSWFRMALIKIAGQAKVNLEVVDLSIDFSQIERLKRCQMSLFSTHEYYLIILPTRLGSQQTKNLQETLSKMSDPWCAINYAPQLNVDKVLILDLSKEKPWDREKRWKEWLVTYCKRRGAYLRDEVYSYLWNSCAPCRMRMMHECDKLIAASSCGGGGGVISIQLAEEVAFFYNPQIVWKVSEQILKNDQAILQEIPKLLNKDPSGISVVSLLQRQWKEALAWIEQERVPKVARNWSSKRQAAMKSLWSRYSAIDLRRGLFYIHSSLFALKNGRDASIELNTLLTRLLNRGLRLGG